MQKLSETWFLKSFHFSGIISRKKCNMALTNCF